MKEASQQKTGKSESIAEARTGLFRWLWLTPGLYRRMIGDYASFYMPDFHPWQVDDRSLIAEAEAGLAQAA